MRQIPILNSDGSIDREAVGIIQACMQFPDDEPSIEEDIAAYRLRSNTGFRKTVLGAYVDKTWQAAKLGGMCAGSMLHTMIMFDKHRPELKVGMNKSAIAVALELRKQGGPTTKNENTIKKYWAEYKNSAHLWAALMIEWQSNRGELPLDFISLLAVAEKLADLGGHLVEGWNPWRAPPALNLQSKAYDVPVPDPDDISLVKQYRADGKYLSSAASC